MMTIKNRRLNLESLKEKMIGFFSPHGKVWMMSPAFKPDQIGPLVSSLEDYVDHTAHIGKSFQHFVDFWSVADNRRLKRKARDMQSELLMAQKLRWEIMDDLTSMRLLLPESRADMIDFVKHVDRVLWSYEPCLLTLPMEGPLAVDLAKCVSRMASKCCILTEFMAKSVRALHEDPQDAIRLMSEAQSLDRKYIQLEGIFSRRIYKYTRRIDHDELRNAQIMVTRISYVFTRALTSISFLHSITAKHT